MTSGCSSAIEREQGDVLTYSVTDEHVVTAIEDQPARRRQRHCSHLVRDHLLYRCTRVENLQIPESHEHQREQGDADDSDDPQTYVRPRLNTFFRPQPLPHGLLRPHTWSTGRTLSLGSNLLRARVDVLRAPADPASSGISLSSSCHIGGGQALGELAAPLHPVIRIGIRVVPVGIWVVLIGIWPLFLPCGRQIRR